MKAFIMAAGAGTRLRPLTYAIPKPMVPVLNKPTIEHTVENLRKHGITRIMMNLHHYPETIKNHFGNGTKFGVDIGYSFEKALLGTAGGVKKCEDFLDSTFVVMSGDGLTDIDLNKAIEFHKKRKSMATMVLKAIDSRFDYGVTIINKDGRIKNFIEKPRWSDVFANTVNTGIYIFEPEIFKYIPKNKFYDFGMHLWPDLLKKKKRIFGYVTNAYWTDVGSLAEYRHGVKDALAKKLKLRMPGKQIKPGIWIGEGTKIAKSAKIVSPCVIGSFCFIEKNAIVNEYTTIGNHSRIGQGATIKNSILWDNVNVLRNANLDNCIIGNGAEVSENISVFEGTVLNME